MRFHNTAGANSVRTYHREAAESSQRFSLFPFGVNPHVTPFPSFRKLRGWCNADIPVGKLGAFPGSREARKPRHWPSGKPALRDRPNGSRNIRLIEPAQNVHAKMRLRFLSVRCRVSRAWGQAKSFLKR